tara:strand:- start:114 stop:284 length:171 start_codon:yes stop_codon:yes gene_type:complete
MTQRKADEQAEGIEDSIDPETSAKIRRARLIILIVTLVGIILPFVLFFLIHGWPFH